MQTRNPSATRVTLSHRPRRLRTFTELLTVMRDKTVVLMYCVMAGYVVVPTDHCAACQELFFYRWRYSPRGGPWPLYNTPPASRSLALSLHPFIPIFLRSVDTSSRHLIFGLPLHLVAYIFLYHICFWNLVSRVLSVCMSVITLTNFKMDRRALDV